MAKRNHLVADTLFTGVTLWAVFLINLFLVEHYN